MGNSKITAELRKCRDALRSLSLWFSMITSIIPQEWPRDAERSAAAAGVTRGISASISKTKDLPQRTQRRGCMRLAPLRNCSPASGLLRRPPGRLVGARLRATRRLARFLCFGTQSCWFYHPPRCRLRPRPSSPTDLVDADGETPPRLQQEKQMMHRRDAEKRVHPIGPLCARRVSAVKSDIHGRWHSVKVALRKHQVSHT
jgi:hypothetical protein